MHITAKKSFGISKFQGKKKKEKIAFRKNPERKC